MINLSKGKIYKKCTPNSVAKYNGVFPSASWQLIRAPFNIRYSQDITEPCDSKKIIKLITGEFEQ